MGSSKSMGLWPAEATLTTRAGAESRSSGKSRPVSKKWERWLTAKVSSCPSSLSSRSGRMTPALLTSTSRRSCSERMRSARSRTAPSEERSARW